MGEPLVRLAAVKRFKGGRMSAKPEDFLLQAWKQQLDLGLRLIETIVDGWRELYEVAARSQAKVPSGTQVHPPAATQKFHRIPIGTLPEGHVGAQPAPARRKPSRRAHAPAAK
jgi:hypothetical protein